MSEQLALLPAYLTGHLQISLLALMFAVALSLPLGIAAARSAVLERWALAGASIIQTIPGLALLAVMVPVLAALHLPSIGFLPAILALTLYAMLPILRNTVTGIAGIDPAVIEAARGVGMTARQQLVRVELPLALPVIVAGVRTATVWTVGMATLATPVGAVSLGNFIFSGLQTRNLAAILVGSCAAAALALVLDALVSAIESGLRARNRRRLAGSAAVIAVLVAYAAASAFPAAQRPLRIGAKPFTEQLVLAEILREHIARRTGVVAEVLPSLGSTVAFDALAGGRIDAYVDYGGTLWTTILKRGEIVAREEMLAAIGASLERDHGIRVAARLGFENAYVLAMREDEAAERGVSRISDLAAAAPGMTIGADYEFFARPEWQRIVSLYGLRFARNVTMDPSLLFPAGARGDVDVVSAYSTDGRLETARLRVLEDDKGAIPPYDALVLVRRGLAEERPEVAAALASLEGKISVRTMRRMNHAVDSGGYPPRQVAVTFEDGLR